MSYSITEAKRIVTEHGRKFKIFYKELDCGNTKLEDLEQNFVNAFYGEFDNEESFFDEWLENSGYKSQLDDIKIGDSYIEDYLDQTKIIRDLSINDFDLIRDDSEPFNLFVYSKRY